MTRREDERRAHPRFSTSIKIDATSEQDGVAARMIANNLSLGGLYCTSSADFPEMTRLAVRLLLPRLDSSNGETEPVEIEAVVVRRRPLPSSAGARRFELGLFFTQLEEDVRERLVRFIG